MGIWIGNFKYENLGCLALNTNVSTVHIENKPRLYYFRISSSMMR